MEPLGPKKAANLAQKNGTANLHIRMSNQNGQKCLTMSKSMQKIGQIRFTNDTQEQESPGQIGHESFDYNCKS